MPHFARPRERPGPQSERAKITLIAQPKTGLGTGIVKALAQQLGAKIETLAGPEGTTVSVTHATFLAKMPGVV
jgi:signal transduction histidine kinase